MRISGVPDMVSILVILDFDCFEMSLRISGYPEIRSVLR